jgi:hypothetical protein
MGDRVYRLRPVRPPVLWVERPELTDRVDRLLGRVDPEAPGLTVGVVGPSGSGRTALLRELCSRRDVRQRYPGGVLWLALGPETVGPALAARLDDVVEAVTGERLGSSDPAEASALLGGAFRGGLVVLDGVWHGEQASVCAVGRPAPDRLLVTQEESLLPPGASVVRVGPLPATPSVYPMRRPWSCSG